MSERIFGNPVAPKQERNEVEKSEILSNKRQQDKIVAILESGNFDLISERLVKIQDDQREEFLRKVAKGEVDELRFKELILNVMPPIDYERDKENPVELYGFVSGNKQMRGVIAEFVRGDFNQRDDLNSSDLAVFLKKYPEPSLFEKDIQEFLDSIEESNGPQKRQEYERSVREFMGIVYGKRQEYYDQIKLLRAEAENKYPELAKEWVGGKISQEFKNFHIETIEDKEAERVLEKVEILGDDFNGKVLSRQILKEEGLSPKHKIRIGDSVVWLSSSAYELQEGRVAVVAYVEKDGKVTARSYYRSNSQGVWRYLPDYRMNTWGEIEWYGKGYSEESITLPVAIQKALSEITREGMPVLKLKQNPDLIFAGTAHIVGKRIGEYYSEVAESPKRLEGNFYAEDDKTPPGQIVLTEEQSPDFSKLLTSWEQMTSVYGKVSVEVFPSKDGVFKFMFCSDEAGRVWIGGIEDNSEMQSTGLKKTWIEGGDLATPAYEYKTARTDQTGGYGNDKIRNGPYVDMYENYIQKIPVIQSYLQSTATPELEGQSTEAANPEQNSTVNGSKNLSELFKVLDRMGGLQGTQEFYSASKLKEIIHKVLRGELSPAYITRTEGLRSKVEELMKLEK